MQSTTDTLVEAAAIQGRRPSIHNAQPWRWVARGETLELYRVTIPARQRGQPAPTQHLHVLTGPEQPLRIQHQQVPELVTVRVRLGQPPGPRQPHSGLGELAAKRQPLAQPVPAAQRRSDLAAVGVSQVGLPQQLNLVVATAQHVRRLRGQLTTVCGEREVVSAPFRPVERRGRRLARAGRFEGPAAGAACSQVAAHANSGSSSCATRAGTPPWAGSVVVGSGCLVTLRVRSASRS